MRGKNFGLLRPWLGFYLALVGLAALVAGCTGEDPNLTGIGLHNAAIDVVLEPLPIYNLENSGNLAVTDSEEPFDKRQVLYFGNQDAESSSMLIRYDFSSLPDEVFVDSLFTEANIDSVVLFLYMLRYYENFKDENGSSLVKTYHVRELVDTLNVSLYPGPEPEVSPFFVNETPDTPEPVGAVIALELSEQKYIEWYQNNGHTGIMVSEGSTGAEINGFIGFSSADLTAFGELSPLSAGTLPYPVIVVRFAALDTVLRMVPMEDVSTLHALDPIPQNFANGMALRTHERSYPYLRFSFADLPPHVFLNRAVVSVANEDTLSYGTLTTLVLSVADSTFATGGDLAVTLEDLDDNVEAQRARFNLDPTGGEEGTNEVIEFEITRFLQGHINAAPEVPLTFVITADENFFAPDFITPGIDPAFYLNRFNFFGSGETDSSLRPALRITYSLDEEISGGGS